MCFDGTNYHGWQIQENALSIFEIFQNAVEKVFGYHSDIKGCSRTDSGVHALCYCANFFVNENLTQKQIYKLPLALNRNLPQDIRVLSRHIVPDEFHSRYSSKGKEYKYFIWNSHIEDPFTLKYHHRISSELNVEDMNAAAEFFIGEHDFSSFMATKSKITDCRRTVFAAKVEKESDNVIFTVSANGYLYNMVRIMAGTLIKVGLGNTKPEEIKDIILAKSRKASGYTAPAKGLFLTNVFYDIEL
jgi:tRNA pseudouridine38-40 synthase